VHRARSSYTTRALRPFRTGPLPLPPPPPENRGPRCAGKQQSFAITYHYSAWLVEPPRSQVYYRTRSPSILRSFPPPTPHSPLPLTRPHLIVALAFSPLPCPGCALESSATRACIQVTRFFSFLLLLLLLLLFFLMTSRRHPGKSRSSGAQFRGTSGGANRGMTFFQR